MQKILVLSPHPDDGEIGCGGTMARFLEEGKEVVHVLFCAAENIGREKVPKEGRFDEFENACDFMGTEYEWYDFPHRRLSEERQNILELMVGIGEQHDPDLVLIPCPTDLHQDHKVIAEEGLRAFKRRNVWGYEMLWNNLTFKTHTFVGLEKRHVEKKESAILKYESQKHRDYINGNFIESLARARGVQIGSKYAEVFEHIRGVI